MRIVISIIFLVLFLPMVVFADWQSDLSAVFDHVETFDNLSDFRGTGYGDVYTGSMPITISSGSTNWDYYSMWDTPNTSYYWIGDHGIGNNWSGSKSLVIDYGGEGDVESASRFGYYVGGGTPDGGYSDIYIFYMLKTPITFFPHSGSTFSDFGYLKTIDISSGFRDVWNWGTSAEQLQTDGSDQVDHQYGLNFCVVNFTQYAGSLRAKLNSYIPNSDVGNYHYTSVLNEYILTSASVAQPIIDSAWFGVQYRIKLSSTNGSSDGVIDVWYYDNTGSLISSQSTTGIVTIDDMGAVSLDHKINKIVLGGNRSESVGFNDASVTSDTMYIDDFIVNGSAIADTYFSMLSGPTITCYKDLDGDGYSDGTSETVSSCSTNYYESTSLTATSGDCNDSNASIYPGNGCGGNAQVSVGSGSSVLTIGSGSSSIGF